MDKLAEWLDVVHQNKERLKIAKAAKDAGLSGHINSAVRSLQMFGFVAKTNDKHIVLYELTPSGKEAFTHHAKLSPNGQPVTETETKAT